MQKISNVLIFLYSISQTLILIKTKKCFHTKFVIGEKNTNLAINDWLLDEWLHFKVGRALSDVRGKNDKGRMELSRTGIGGHASKQARGEADSDGKLWETSQTMCTLLKSGQSIIAATNMHFAREAIVAKSDLDYSTLPWSSSRFLLCIKQSRPKQEPWGCFQTRIWIGDMCALCPHPFPSTRVSIIGQLTGCASQKYSRRALQVVPSLLAYISLHTCKIPFLNS